MIHQTIKKKSLVIFAATISTPYVMLKSDRNLTGNDRFEGFCIDLLRTIAELLGFNYDLYLVPDNKFGAENTTSGEWSGLVREIIEKVFSLLHC
ncbi:UNVERIFIED_CONTAM: Glutamate receptor [Trichonephila clavipes]